VIPNITRGGDAGKLLSYLVGRWGDGGDVHEDPHLVAGSSEAVAFYGGRVLSPRGGDVPGLAGFLDELRVLSGTEVTVPVRDEAGVIVDREAAHVWHCSLSLHADEGRLSDKRWQEIAASFVAGMGFDGPDVGEPCRWAAIHHGVSRAGNDHLHIAVVLIDEVGKRANVHLDRPRAQRICRQLEETYGLRKVGSEQLPTTSRSVKRAELERDRPPAPTPAGSPDRYLASSRQQLERIVRAAAASVSSEAQFVGQLVALGVTFQPRWTPNAVDEVSGYSVALPGKPAQPFAAGKLARDLTLPKLRVGWAEQPGDRQAAILAWRDPAAYARNQPPAAGDHPVPPASAAEVVARLERQVTAPDVSAAAVAAASQALANLAAVLSTRSDAPDRIVLSRMTRPMSAIAGGRRRYDPLTAAARGVNQLARQLAPATAARRSEVAQITGDVEHLARHLARAYRRFDATATADMLDRATTSAPPTRHPTITPGPPPRTPQTDRSPRRGR
jgi:hypothetical protein